MLVLRSHSTHLPLEASSSQHQTPTSLNARCYALPVLQGAGSISDDTVAYLEVKQQLLLSYCINVTFYMLLKVRHHTAVPGLLAA